jgi:hypothetical protein
MPHLRPIICLVLLVIAVGQANGQTQPNVLRWAEGNSGCTFSADDDGKYRYGLWTDDFGIVIAVDADEIRKASLRIEPLVAIFVTVRYRGKGALSFDPASASLEFASHSHAVQNAIDADDFARKLQSNADAFAQEIQREITKHPEEKEERESMLRVHENDVMQTEEFLRSRSLRPVQLDSANSEATGWIFFNAKSKWIGDWKKQEQFVLRVPIPGQVIEFPFALPPSQGDLLLRRR